MSEADGALDQKLEALRRLEEIVERLRGPGGCPWDRAQTLLSMAPNLLEEACETVDEIREGAGQPTGQVCDELGDVLMNVLLAARIAEEGGGFGLREVAEGISAKLIRRHPHVFGEERASSVGEVLTRWNAIKAKEKGGAPASRLGKIPRSLPGVAAAMKIGERAAALRFDWPDAQGALRKVEEETREVEEALESGAGGERVHHELGDLLFAAVNLARKAGVDAEAALRGAVDRFQRRFHHVEARTDVTTASLEEMEALWNEAKGHEC